MKRQQHSNRDSRLISNSDPRLYKVSELVLKGDDLRTLAKDMQEVMAKYSGVGLAAPQVGVNKRIIAVNYAGTEFVMINPIITYKPNTKKVKSIDEGCLSFPGKRVTIKRRKRIRVTGWDVDYNPISIDARGFLAFVIQHEIDHLNGITIINRN